MSPVVSGFFRIRPKPCRESCRAGRYNPGHQHDDGYFSRDEDRATFNPPINSRGSIHSISYCARTGSADTGCCRARAANGSPIQKAATFARRIHRHRNHISRSDTASPKHVWRRRSCQRVSRDRFDDQQRHSHRAKTLNAFSAKNDGFTDAKEKYWADEQEQVRNSDLAEPLASQFGESLSVDQTKTIPMYRAWFTAMRSYATAAGHLLEVADSHLGNLKWQNKRLTTTDSHAATDLAAAQRAVSDAERRCNEMGWAASNRHDHVVEFVRSTMLELEKELRRRNGP
jgi:hypothetical protein